MAGNSPLAIRYAVFVGLAVSIVVLAGCETGGKTLFPQALFPKPETLHDDIVAIHGIQVPDPWLRDPDGRIAGITIRTYFVSAATGKGAFVPGTIRAILHVVERRPGGGYDRLPGYAWQFPEDEAFPFRIIKPAMGGESYGFILKWPPELDVMGRRIEIRFVYRRGDGREVVSPARQLQVPLPHGFEDPRGRPFVPPPLNAVPRPAPDLTQPAAPWPESQK